MKEDFIGEKRRTPLHIHLGEGNTHWKSAQNYLHLFPCTWWVATPIFHLTFIASNRGAVVLILSDGRLTPSDFENPLKTTHTPTSG